jgi:hypothetical protein
MIKKVISSIPCALSRCVALSLSETYSIVQMVLYCRALCNAADPQNIAYGSGA